VKQQNATETQPPADSAPTISVGEANPVFADLAGTLSEIRKLKGVAGYILRSKTAAIVDLTEREAAVEYAMLSSQIHDCSRVIAPQFNLADVESVLVEGKTVKVLCIDIGENRISVFMDNACAHAWIVKRILL
jgi:predicted regulator of Ras-like GTPase activity (Roadblock/LC7/MglB family)